MVKNTQSTTRREDRLSRERIIEEAIALLDSSGESGLTFRALAECLSTGAGAIYWHIANKNDLMTEACDEIIVRTMNAPVSGETPEDVIRSLALGMFDAIDDHPWIGSALTRAPYQMPVVRILERLGQQVRAMGVPEAAQFAAVSALINYILGVGGQNAANAQIGRELGGDREAFLVEVSSAWLALDPDEYPFTRSIATQFRDHDDRLDFLAGIDLILRGIQSALP